jgi:hypothetical protein
MTGMPYRKYSKEDLEDAVSKAQSFREVLLLLNTHFSPSAASHISKMTKKFEIDHSHFQRQPKTRNRSPLRLTPNQILIILPEGQGRMKAPLLRRALKEMNVEEVCNRCKRGPEWQGKFLRLEINHIDGDWRNCLFENLEFICPNCHSQETETNQPHKNSNKFNDR